VTSAVEGKIMNISKDQIIQFLESQGSHDQAQQAGQQLPDQVDTDNGDHVQLLSKLGIDPKILGGLGNLL
jgi:predicted heme/steroid binding protein